MSWLNRFIIGSLFGILLSSCAAGTIKKTDCEASYISMFKDIDNVTMSGCGASAYGTNSREKLSGIISEALIQSLSR